MKHKNILIFVAGALSCLLLTPTVASAAKELNFTENASWHQYSIRFTDKISDYTDEDTGVHYFIIYDDSSMNAMCPRYNADGTLMVDKEKK